MGHAAVAVALAVGFLSFLMAWAGGYWGYRLARRRSETAMQAGLSETLSRLLRVHTCVGVGTTDVALVLGRAMEELMAALMRRGVLPPDDVVALRARTTSRCEAIQRRVVSQLAAAEQDARRP